VALEAFVGDLPNIARKPLAGILVGLGVVTSALAYTHWMAAERALRQGRPLPAVKLAPVLSYGVAICGVIVVVSLSLS
jgi:putative membrane protein